MGLRASRALVWKDLQIFFGDRRAMILSFAVPIAIASFFGSIFSGASDNDEPAKIAVAIVDRDGSAISRGIIDATGKDKNLAVTTPSNEVARNQVQEGDIAVAVIIPPGFGDAAGRAFFAQGEKPQLDVLYDPSRAGEVGMVRGILTGHVVEAVGQQMFGGTQGQAVIDKTLKDLDSVSLPSDQREVLRTLLQSVQTLNWQNAAAGQAFSGTMAVPYDVREQAVTSGVGTQYNGYAHSFGGMGVQFLLFVAIDLGMGILLERERGIWKRLRSAPLSRTVLLGAKAVSGTLLTFLTLLVSFAFAILVFGVRIQGSVIGFMAVALACSTMAAAFGLLVAALGNSQAATRRIATFAVLIMVMLGGAWVPSFVFPAWLQRLTVVIPARWAVDGLDAMTWRGLGIEAAVMPSVVLLAFAALFGALALWRFRWDEA